MELSKNALTVLERRYLMKNGEGVVIETVEELFRRVAGAIAASDRRYDENADCEALADSFDDQPGVFAQLPNLNERGEAAGSAVRLFCASGGGYYGGHF